MKGMVQLSSVQHWIMRRANEGEQRWTYHLQRRIVVPVVCPSRCRLGRGYTAIASFRPRCVRPSHYGSNQRPVLIIHPSIQQSNPAMLDQHLTPTHLHPAQLSSTTASFPRQCPTSRKRKLDSHAPIQTTDWDLGRVVVTR